MLFPSLLLCVASGFVMAANTRTDNTMRDELSDIMRNRLNVLPWENPARTRVLSDSLPNELIDDICIHWQTMTVQPLQDALVEGDVSKFLLAFKEHGPRGIEARKQLSTEAEIIRREHCENGKTEEPDDREVDKCNDRAYIVDIIERSILTAADLQIHISEPRNWYVFEDLRYVMFKDDAEAVQEHFEKFRVLDFSETNEIAVRHQNDRNKFSAMLAFLLSRSWHRKECKAQRRCMLI